MAPDSATILTGTRAEADAVAESLAGLRAQVERIKKAEPRQAAASIERQEAVARGLLILSLTGVRRGRRQKCMVFCGDS